MNPHDDEQDLRERFARLRRADGAQAPDFRRLVDGARGARARPRSLAPALLAGGVIAAVGLAAIQRLAAPPVERGPTLSEWSAPTDFLLRTPGHELLFSSPGFAPTSPLDPGTTR